MTFEKEQGAINLFVKKFKGAFSKIDGQWPVYKVYDSKGAHIAYAGIVDSPMTIHLSYPLPVAVKKIVSITDKRMPCVCIWACNDGIIYGQLDKVVGAIKWGASSPIHSELLAYYDKQPNLKYVKFTSSSF